ncbi:hypothetical protein [uncultured Actinomyces sp.]|uniref:hypothetical protein n=1 Tax=uncultured Actinomyces sp. TaxID=249061 RepID=UPI0028DBF672|nr:hypothetical protein [uncultured Actinomyces sp.]
MRITSLSALPVAVLLVASLTACSGDSQGTDAEAGGSSASTTADPSASAEADATTSADASASTGASAATGSDPTSAGSASGTLEGKLTFTAPSGFTLDNQYSDSLEFLSADRNQRIVVGFSTAPGGATAEDIAKQATASNVSDSSGTPAAVTADGTVDLGGHKADVFTTCGTKDKESVCARIAVATEGSTMTALMWTTRVRDGGQAAPVSADEFKAAAAGLKG